MSLLTEAFEDATVMNFIRESDGRGGMNEYWKDGATIKVAFAFDSSTEARIADKEGTHVRYSLVTDKSILLKYHDVIRRESDKRYFRVTSKGDDMKTPRSSSLHIRQVEAEEWELTSEVNNG